jgi:hypothetical protein
MALTTLEALKNHRDSGTMHKDHISAFAAKFGMHPVKLTGGTELYKYSDSHPYSDKDQKWSAWWSARAGTQHVLEDGRKVSWTGLSARQTKAMNDGTSDVRQARVRSAVRDDWNSLQNLFIAVLQTEVAWAWFGRCSGQPVVTPDPNTSPKVFYIGGDYQYYIPELQRHELRILSASCGSDDGKL